MNDSSNLPATASSSRDLAGLGPPALFEGEDAGTYGALLARMSSALEPSDFLEEIWMRDVVELVWEMSRLRRLKTELMREASYEGVREVLEPRDSLFFPHTGVSAQEMAKRWASGDREASAIVERVLASSRLTMDAVRARVLTKN